MTRMTAFLFAACAATLVAARPSGGEEPPRAPKQPPTSIEAAGAVLAAADAKDAAALKELAARLQPDAWLVADQLVGRGRPEVAAAFATAAAAALGEEVAALPAYLATPAAAADQTAGRKAIEAVNAAAVAKKVPEALAILEPLDLKADSVVAIRLQIGRARMRRSVGRGEEADRDLDVIQQGAERLGWLRFAALAAAERADGQRLAGAMPAAVEGMRGALVLARRTRDLPLTGRLLQNLAAVLINQSAYGEARAVSAEAVSVAERAGAPDLLCMALINHGALHAAFREFDAAQDVMERALAVARESGDPTLLGQAKQFLSMLVVQRGDLRGAVERLEELRAAAQARGDAVGELAAVHSLGFVHGQRGQVRESRLRYEEALALAKKVDDKGAEAIAAASLGLALWRMGQHVDADAMFVRAEALGREVGNADVVARATFGLGSVRASLGQHSAALELFLRARTLAEARGDRVQAARALSSVGATRSNLGELAAAYQLAEQAAQELRGLDAPNHLADALVLQGTAALALSRFDRALECLEQALAVAEPLPDRVAFADILSTLAAVYSHLGDPARARTLLDRAMQIFEQAGCEPKLLLALNTLGSVQQAEEPREALASYERVMALAERLGDRPGMALGLTNAAIQHGLLGELEEARALHARAVALWAELGEREQESLGLSAQAENLVALRLLDEARGVAERALTLARATGSPNSRSAALQAAAHVAIDSRDPASALKHCREAAEALESQVGGLSDEQGAGARERWKRIFAYGALAGWVAGDAAETYHFLESGRAGALREALGGRTALRGLVTDQRLLAAEQEARAAEQLALRRHRDALRGTDAAAGAATGKAVEAAHEKLRSAVERIQRSDKAAAGLAYPRPAALADVQRRLGADQALLLYGLFQTRALCVVVTRGAARLVDLGELGPIEDACRTLTEQAEGSRHDEALASLQRLALEPLALEPALRRLLISPHGALSYAPWGALTGERVPALVPSASAWLLLADLPRPKRDGVLALGDPSYGAEPPASAVALLRSAAPLTPLPASRDEAKAVGTVVLLGAQATEDGLRKALAGKPGWRAVHLACHGLVNPALPARSALALTPTADNDGLLSTLEVLRLTIPADLAVLSACQTGQGRVFEAEGIVGLTRAFMFAGTPRVLVSLWDVDDRATQLLMEDFYRLWNKDGLTASAALHQAQLRLRDREEDVVDAEASRREGREVLVKGRPFAAPRFWAGWVLWGLAD